MNKIAENERGPSPSFPKILEMFFRLFSKLALIALFLVVGLFIGGFFKYSTLVTSAEMPTDVATSDAIVVLTGGSSRISKGLMLMAEQKAKRVLISGVNPATKMHDILKLNQPYKSLFNCCVDLERVALDTVGNAVESQKWMKAHGFNSLILVTSSYHMPRSLVEFRRAMPDISIVPFVVPNEDLKKEKWWTKSASLRLVLSEYIKYLAANLRKYLGPNTFSALRATMQGG